VKHADLAKNSVTSTNVKDGSLLSQDFKAGQLPAGAQGPKGDTGPQGPKGDTGTVDTTNFYTKADSDARRATVAWVVVASNGTILRQSGGFTVTKTATGAYTVDTPLDESKLGYAASTFREPGGGTAPGFVTAFANTAAGFRVNTYDATGASADGGFGLIAPFVKSDGTNVG
jgi:hypothetical protein